MRLPLIYVPVAMTLLAGCGSLRPVAPVVDGPNGVRVLVRAQDDERFELEVVNYGGAPIVVDRDRVVLVTARGERAARVAGGARRIDDVPPGGHDALDVRFRLGVLRTGDRVAIDLAGAVTLNGRPVRVPPLEFVAD